MPCDGKNASCERRRELLAQLKCLVSSMDQKKPCEWDEPAREAPICFPVCPPNEPPCCIPVKASKSFELRASLMFRCECIKRNGLQDRCMVVDCMGRPECMTKLYPVCEPGQAVLLKLTDLGDPEVALRKYYCADQARESALAAYCRLMCGSSPSGAPACHPQDDRQCSPPPVLCCRQIRVQECCPPSPPPPPCCPNPNPNPPQRNMQCIQKPVCPQMRIEKPCCPSPPRCPSGDPGNSRNGLNSHSGNGCPTYTICCPPCPPMRMPPPAGEPFIICTPPCPPRRPPPYSSPCCLPPICPVLCPC